ncbi:hypothetical protein H257_04856 [Aphanomyces astaci]|uniref:Crinkler effector protein N-terminal domain-containing protein n=1 Tax=Aphanomyces astaci TaxID=112090 RepID=W4GW56_APHAT|nr:hypothetical protein H257_04856 [Aphanomyces astaci]ETV83133.1 hypothetical protein H257_04856 [Aphanomyces astaci]|eukprot:XP_009827804.1 hypothetical protein H257_04856 [Aphanomyces astaci]
MLKLIYHIVGAREPCAVKIDANQFVADLKNKIKEQNPTLVSPSVMDLHLYQSLKDATWLSAEDLDQMISDGVMDANLATIPRMEPTDDLAYYFGPNPPLHTKRCMRFFVFMRKRCKLLQLPICEAFRIPALMQGKAIANFVPNVEAPAFWSQADQANANGILVEMAFVAFITPFFDAVLANCDMVFVNSEQVAWMPQGPPLPRSSTNLKPVRFATYRGMYHATAAPMDHVHYCPSEHAFRFGEPEKQLMGCVVLFESKLRITDSAFGQVVNLIGSGGGRRGERRVPRSWCPRSCVQGRAENRQKSAKTCLVDSSSTSDLYREEWALKYAKLTGLTAHIEYGLINFPGGAALLVTPVGAPLPRPTTLQEVVNLFDLLRQLHKKNVIHGDPRVPNVIVVKDNGKDKLLWIDLVEALEVAPAFCTTDAAILTRSILRLPHRSLLEEPLESLTDEYGEAPTSENAHRLATAVFQSTKFSA